MDAFTLVSNASVNCYPKKSLCSYTNFLQEQLHLREEWDLAFSEKLYPLFQQNVTKGTFTFVDGKESSEEIRKIERYILNMIVSKYS